MPNNKELTTDQAGDVARFFLGPQWRAATLGLATYEIRDISSFDKGANIYTRRFMGDSWREVFRLAGIKLPSRSRYTQQGTSVMLNGEHIAACASGTKARLICAALNDYDGASVSLQ